jgi:hypothetical protein
LFLDTEEVSRRDAILVIVGTYASEAPCEAAPEASELAKLLSGE